jgi:hypothetical protein
MFTIFNLFTFSDILGDSTASDGSSEKEISSSERDGGSLDNMTPEALPFVGADGGQTKRTNPLIYKGGMGRVRTPLSRGGGHAYSLHHHGKGKGKKSSISSIFQTSVTSLAFLAFGGYLLCLVVQAIRGRNGTTMMLNSAALNANTSKFVLLGRRPLFGKRRKRESKEKHESSGYLDSNALKEKQGEMGLAMKMAEIKTESSTVLRKFGLSAIQEHPDGSREVPFHQTEPEDLSDEDTVEMSDDEADTKDMYNENAQDEEEMERGHWPLAKIEDMYQALVMISEGYSLYHETFHTG